MWNMIHLQCALGGAGFLPSTDSEVEILHIVRGGRGSKASHSMWCSEVLDTCLLECMMPHRGSRLAGHSPPFGMQRCSMHAWLGACSGSGSDGSSGSSGSGSGE